MMTKAEVDKLIADMPNVIDMGKAGKWHKENLCQSRDWYKTYKPNTPAKYYIPIEVTIDGVCLNPKYDIVHLKNNDEHMPLLEDFMMLNQLVGENLCEKVHLKDNIGLLLKKVDEETNADYYLFFPSGYYWTSSCEKDPEGIIIPVTVQIDAEGIAKSEYRSGYFFMRGIQQ